MKTIFAVVMYTMCILFKGVDLKTFYPVTAGDLQSVINGASAGDVISLLPEEYKGDFAISKSGREGSPIRIVGTSKKDKNTRITGNGKAFDIKADYWIIQNLEIREGDVAVNVVGNHNLLNSLAINKVKKGVIINGFGNVVKSCAVKNLGTGITIEKGDFNKILSCALTLRNPSLNVFPETCCGNIDENTFNGPVEIKGNQYSVSSNVGNDGVNIYGCDNEFNSNVFMNVFFTKACSNVDGGSNVYTGVSDKLHPFNMEMVGSDSNGASANFHATSLMILAIMVLLVKTAAI